ncbi:MFS transporter [Pseudalkalibacillus berkeleyi]|uniref:MFS transporter n=1 Tax=Pseudalkalibacillus berkeleyi TaxID=1069813 RepID=A0ABS9H5Z3_9BACL|nr:MFS transporter [Pseudalkalibacillus berkeleyi]MCF6139293.1 MFS transporter [Pseudalkalibacillus berkeleyi]
MRTARYRFNVLISVVFVSGFAQGMLLPLLAILLENAGVSSSINGLSASAFYIGILVISPFIEKPLHKFGYKRMIVTGIALTGVSLLVFPLWQAIWFWFILRLIIGIGDHIFHFATQVWLTSISVEGNRGKNISIYGVSFGLGFGVGPVMTKLIEVNTALPFVVASILCVLALFLLIRIEHEYPENIVTTDVQSTWQRYGKVFKLSWPGLLGTFGYGFIETTVHSNFPVYAVRQGLGVDAVSILLPAFAIGALIFQVPLGLLSDKLGRKPILVTSLLIGGISFILMTLNGSLIYLTVMFIIAGLFLGSLFSMGITFMADLLPKELLPAGNILAGICFSLGSIFGPLIGGLAIQVLEEGSIFYTIGGMMLLLFIGVSFFQPRKGSEVAMTE